MPLQKALHMNTYQTFDPAAFAGVNWSDSIAVNLDDVCLDMGDCKSHHNAPTPVQLAPMLTCYPSCSKRISHRPSGASPV